MLINSQPSIAPTAAPEDSTRSAAAETLSAILGWSYFLCWSLSFYPQVVLNYQRKSIAGMSLDYQLFNILGYTCYSIYTGSLLFNDSIRKEYDNNFGPNLVSVNDFFFALHGLVLTVITLFQCSIFDRGGQTFAKTTVLLVSLTVTISALYALLIIILSTNGVSVQLYNDLSLTSWLCWIYWLSLVKLGVTLCKYVPQAVMNCKSKSTVGWSIHNVLLDFTGGFLSVAQLLLDGATLGWSGLIGDPIKFALGFVSVAFDALFILQHYVLFTDRTDKAPGLRSSGDGSARAEPTMNLLSDDEHSDLVDGKFRSLSRDEASLEPSN